MNKLTSMGFELNSYDKCITSKMIYGKQCKIIWHVDDQIISHVDPKVISNVLDELNTGFAKEAKLAVTRGKNRDYLGMKIEYTDDRKVIIVMDKYVKSILDELPLMWTEWNQHLQQKNLFVNDS